LRNVDFDPKNIFQFPIDIRDADDEKDSL
jgi:hypothetical protein